MYFMLCCTFTIHNQLSNICCVGGKKKMCLPHFPMYVMLEVIDVYHTQHQL